MEFCSGGKHLFFWKIATALIYLTARFLTMASLSTASVALPNLSDKKTRRKQNSQQLGVTTTTETYAVAILAACLCGNAVRPEFSRR